MHIEKEYPHHSWVGGTVLDGQRVAVEIGVEVDLSDASRSGCWGETTSCWSATFLTILSSSYRAELFRVVDSYTHGTAHICECVEY